MRNFSRWRNFNRTRRATGKRSELEVQVAAQLDKLGVKYGYESRKITFEKPAKARTYTPDFVLENGVIIEAKGLFDTADRQKHLLVKEQHPTLDIRFVFSSPNQRISKQSKTTYAMWCEKYGFLYAKASVPKEWLPCSEHDLQPDGSNIEYFYWKCSRCGYVKDSVRGHQ